ncbi:unnamed protein product [Alopecurus aequalis]
MPRAGISAGSQKVDFVIDTGNPLLNRTVDGFIKIGAVGACKVLAEDAFECIHKGNVSTDKLEKTLKRSVTEGAYWGAAAGLYVGVEYGVEKIRGKYDWKNALIGGVVSGALVSAANNSKADKIATDAITAGALATAVEFINYLT